MERGLVGVAQALAVNRVTVPAADAFNHLREGVLAHRVLRANAYWGLEGLDDRRWWLGSSGDP